MTVWFDGSSEIECNIQQIKTSIENLGEHYVGIVSLMPGLTSVDLVEQGSDYVIIKTNEGLMKRKYISKTIHADQVIVEFDEDYQAGLIGTVKSHYYIEFKKRDAGVEVRVILSNIEAPGILGFFYRTFGKSSIGNAVLSSYKTYFEDL
jgi:hypothetical protein